MYLRCRKEYVGDQYNCAAIDYQVDVTFFDKKIFAGKYGGTH